MTIRNLPKSYAQLYILQTLIYASWQKGAIENANKLIRQYFPKGTDFRLVSDDEVLQVQRKLNQRPRAKINFSSPLKESYGMISQFCTCLLRVVAKKIMLKFAQLKNNAYLCIAFENDTRQNQFSQRWRQHCNQNKIR